MPSNSILGDIDNYFVKRFGFNKNCKVIAFTGDNPGSLIGNYFGFKFLLKFFLYSSLEVT